MFHHPPALGPDPPPLMVDAAQAGKRVHGGRVPDVSAPLNNQGKREGIWIRVDVDLDLQPDLVDVPDLALQAFVAVLCVAKVKGQAGVLRRSWVTAPYICRRMLLSRKFCRPIETALDALVTIGWLVVRGEPSFVPFTTLPKG